MTDQHELNIDADTIERLLCDAQKELDSRDETIKRLLSSQVGSPMKFIAIAIVLSALMFSLAWVVTQKIDANAVVEVVRAGCH